MKTTSATRLCILALLATAPAHGETDRPEAEGLRSGVLDVLSLATLGTIKVQEQAVAITRSGADYHVRMPLQGFSAPADAALEAVAHPLNGGVWDILSMKIPPAGTVESAAHDGAVNRTDYTIGQQAIHARIDPGLAQPSSFAATFSDIGLQSRSGEQQNEQSIGRYSMEGRLSAETAGRVTYITDSKAETVRLKSRLPDGGEISNSIKTLAGHLVVENVDRIQGARFLTASQALFAVTQEAVSDHEPAQSSGDEAVQPPGDEAAQPAGVSDAQRQALRGMVDAADGLMTRFEADQTLDGIRFSAGSSTSGSLGRMHLDMRGDALAGHLTAHMNIALDGLALNSLSPETAAYVPHHVAMRAALADVRIGPLMAFLRAATGPDADPVALREQVMGLLNEPDMRFGIESLTFDSGPLRMTGSARLVPHADGQPGVAIHLSAAGVDALIAQAQKTPALQQALPMMFLAKGMGRPEGGAVVWDIGLGDGPITINGVPFGQSGARTR